MDEKMKYAAAAVAIIALALIAAYFSGLFSTKGTSDLLLTAEVVPASVFAGEAAELQITVFNRGSAPVDSAILQLSEGGFVLAQRTISVSANGNFSTTMKWIASEPGTRTLRLEIDAGNLITESDEANNGFPIAVSVSPAEQPDAYGELPSDGILRAYYFNASTGGLNQIIGIFAAGGEDQAFYQQIFSKLHEGQLGIAHYANGSQAAAFVLKSELTASEFFASVGKIAGFEAPTSETTIAGKNVAFFEFDDGITSLCAFREGGWGKILLYKRFFPPVDVFNNTVGENTTCLDLASRDFDSANATEFLAAAKPLQRQSFIGGDTLLEALVRSGSEQLYARGFNDSNSAFLLMISDSSVLVPQNCPGELMSEGNLSICHMQQAALMEKVEMEAYARKQGQYSVVVFIAPLQGTNLALARASALEIVRDVSFPGVPEYVWGTMPTQLSFCSFPSALLCTMPSIENGTLRLNLTLLSAKPSIITGFKCTQEKTAPTEPFTLAEPIQVQPDQTIGIEQPCYITGSVPFNGTIMFLQAELFVNITDAETNESRMLNGKLLINNMGGGLPSFGG